ncbi:hypothetical protein PGT21_028263 [Puccinia graminis f. sp. tritici]|uniref:Uncharacterized protein n=1 Tax=Puccinia graminis f. sp. tritici TaxID=56615 RepID=A0A5B0P753_PUCGR|nr:hypothetical protein PGTUg99_012440 [Puccinia graminis f. sp. tritici]KAA1104621.1 hypothetical protein PGT21_028263 [Puccinia graminis f. sp. tritici]
MRVSHLLILSAFLSLVNSLGISNQSRVFLRRSTFPKQVFPYRQASIKKARQIDLSTPGSPTVSLKPSATSTAPTAPPPRSNSRQDTRSSSILKKKFYAYFQECNIGVRVHVQRIKKICSGKITNESAKKISWELLVELQAILALCLTCLRKIKSCGRAPIPSSLPGISLNSPSLRDLGQIVLQLLNQLKICFNEMNIVCSRYEIIRTTCSDCLVHISSSISGCLYASNAHINGFLATVTNLLGGNPLSFFGLDKFGLDSIIKILQ